MLQRRSAEQAFIARRLARIRWTGPAPGPLARWRLVEICRAELEWSVADWRRLGGDVDERTCRFGPHPSEAWRLPHEQAAAVLLNCHFHVDLANNRLGEMKRRLRAQRAAALDGRQSERYRAYWAGQATAGIGEYREQRRRRRIAWRRFLVATRHYLEVRAAIDAVRALAA